MIPCKGRSLLKQYMRKKPMKRGIKIWMRPEAVNGYVSRIEVYTGKKGKSGTWPVVKHLSEDLHCIWISFALACMGVYGCVPLSGQTRKYFQKL